LTDEEKSRPSDARAVRSRKALREALLQLVEKKNFDQVTIREITATAKVSYPTFFRNYSSKTDLLGDIAAGEVRQLVSLMYSYVDRADVKGNADAICSYVEARRLLWTVLLTTGASAVMREEFIRTARESVKQHGRINPGLPLELATGFVAGGLFEILAWWLRQPVDFPVRRVAAFLELLVLEPTVVPHDLLPE
jgi:AcrR family transcriptional regulator